MKDYYAILGVSPTSPSAEIRRVYRRLALQYHPDKNPSPEAEDIFQEINEAYEVLGDEANRGWYDMKRRHGVSDFETETEVFNDAPQHRDPAYNRRTRQPPPQKSEKRIRQEFMETCLPYIKWLTTAGLITMGIFFLDFVLPPIKATETITSHGNTEDNRMSSYMVYTTGFHAMRVYGGGGLVELGKDVDIEYTPFLRIVLKMADHENKDYYVRSRGIYGPIFIFPLFLFGTAIASFYYRKNTEQSFHFNIAIGILFILVLYFVKYG